MNTELALWLISLLQVVLLSQVVGSSVYCGLRALEKRNRDSAFFINIFGLVALLMAIGVFTSHLLMFALLMPLLIGLGGAPFHEKSGGASRHPAESFFLMAFAALLSGSIEIFVLELFSFRWAPLRSQSVLSYLGNPFLYFLLLVVPVALTPFLLWIYRNLRLRPGIDRHLNEDEAASRKPVAP